jgi:hypothetical protein
MKLTYVGKTNNRRLNGKPLRNGQEVEVSDKDGEYLATLPDFGGKPPVPAEPEISIVHDDDDDEEEEE